MNNNKIANTLILFAGVAIILSSLAMAAPTGATATQVGEQERGTGTSSGQATIEGGNVSETNISGNAITAKWAGFYGFISGGVLLSDASANKFYEWTVSNLSNSVIFAANGSITDWNLIAMDSAYAPAGIISGGMDDFNFTFTQTATFSSTSIAAVSNTPFATTFQNGVMGALRTYALLTPDNTVNIWAGVAIMNTTSFKTGEKVDYQILAPAKGSGTVYHFYLDLP
jgi:hypothetical protein